ncbi:MAG: isochorismate synthase [candidate division Zixibacteria bacterium]|nr:isochorismate synthase [candidate division Zixibacteria bacterium]
MTPVAGSPGRTKTQAKLRAAIVDALSRIGSDSPLLRVAVHIDELDLLTWLDRQSAAVKTYWRNRSDSLETAGVGVADELSLSDGQPLLNMLETLQEQLLHTEPDLRYYGGVRFDPHTQSNDIGSKWQPFGMARFVLPRFEIVRDDSGYRLACNLTEKDLTQSTPELLADAVDELSFDPVAPDGEDFSVGTRQDIPNRDRWTDDVRNAVSGFTRDGIEKLVLARQSAFRITGSLTPWRLLSRLRPSGRNCFLFGLQPEKGVAFVGTTPERLYRRDQHTVRSEALAGTRPRGVTTEQDRALEKQLLGSEKERREHKYVADNVSGTLDSLCDHLEVTHEYEVVKLHRVQHLRSRFVGQLHHRAGDSELLCQLPPTPAVAGYPVAAACAELGRVESFDRGWFAGPVGWIGADAAEFAVAIRSGLVRDEELTLYAGAGIVKGSRAGDEWLEIENKIAHFLLALGVQVS